MNPAIFGPVFASVVLDASGAGSVSFQATGQSMEIRNMSVRVSTTSAESTATVYKNQIGAAYQLSATQSGSTGDNNADPIPLTDGEKIIIEWTGGDVGATATATISGVASVTGGGFRAVA